ncbi:MAG: T9SS type A sorting domain-containing protein [Flavobacterium sp.]
MKRIIHPNFNLVEMINVTIQKYILTKRHSALSFNMKSSLLLVILFCNSLLFAQNPTISYQGVQSTYTVGTAMSPLTPTLGGGTPTDRTNVSTVAGSGTSGYLDGSTASPKFYSPTGIAIAASGTMYIADSQNHVIRKITASGLVSTFAGSGVAGFLNGDADVAQFNAPFAVAVDASENVYVTEAASYSIRKITQAGVVSTLAGKETTSGFLDGQGAGALFAAPKGIDVDSSGNIYVADANSNRIRKVTPAGVVTTIAGDGTAGYLDGQGTAARFNNPIGVAVASSGAIYVSDASNNRIRLIATSGAVTTVAGSGASGIVNGQGTAAQFNAPRAITIDGSGNIYVVDYNNNRIRKITSSGAVTTLSGTGSFGAVNGAGTLATFKYPEGIAVDASGNCFVADVTNNCIRKITSTGDTTTYSGSATRGLENGQSGAMAMFNSPVAVAVTSGGIVYVIDDFNSCIRKVTANGAVSTFVGNTTTGYVDGSGTSAYFNNPKGMVLDAAGNIYVADTFNNRIRKVTPAGIVTTIAGDGTAGYLDGQGTAAKFNNPYGLTIDAAGNLYVADTKNHRIRKISTSGTVTTVAGYILSGYADGASTVARFKNPQGITIDNTTGILYVADTANNRIRKIATDGTVSTFAGSYAGYQDEQGIAAYFNNPIGITRDSAGNFYVADYYNSVIRKITGAGLVSTYAGNGSSEYNDGIGNVASFYFPVGVTTDASDDVYVADSYTQRIRKITSVDPFSISPVLPAGMVFDTTTGVISGTPTEVRTTMTYTIGASNYTGTGTTTIAFATGTGSSAPGAPTATTQAFCNGTTVASLVATGTNLKWYNVASGGTALASTTALSTGTYYVSQTVNSLESSRTSVAVTINTTAAPTASAQAFCNAATVASLVATGTNLKWYNVTSGGTALASTTALSTGTYYVSQTLNSCESSRTSVAVTINTTAAPTASAQTYDNGADVADLIASGTNLQWYTAASGGTALASTTLLSTGTYYVSQTLNSCESTRTSVAVTINTAPGAPTATAQAFCNGATVASLVATGTNLKWYNAASGGTALASTTALSTGIYYVSQTVNSLESSRTSVAVTINTTAAPTASAQAFCNAATVASLVATGTNLKWYNVASGGTALASITALSTGTYYVSQTLNSCESTRTAVSVTINTTAAPTASAQTYDSGADVADLIASGTNLQWYTTTTGGTALASTTLLSTGTYYVSQTLNSCESSRTAVSVTINTAPGAPIASAQAFCNAATVANLVATGTNLKWYNVASGGSALVSTTALSTGTYYVSQTVNSLESSRTSVAVTINTTAAPTASAHAFCNAATIASLVATGTNLKWYNVASGGTALASTTALSTGTYYVSQTLNSCEGSRASVAVTINTTAAPTASAQAFCNAATVASLVATGTNLKWYNVASGGTALASTTALSTGTYYVSQTLNSCESTRTAVSVTINTTAAPTASAQTYDSGADVADLVALGTNLQWYTAASGGTVLASTTLLSTGTYYVSQTLNSCESSRTAVSVTINTAPGAPTATAQAFCNAATVANLVATGTNLKWYNAVSGGTALASTTALSTGTYYVSQTVNSLESSRTSVAVTINTTAAPTASAQVFCNAATVASLVATGTNLKWYSVASGGTALVSTTALPTGTYYVSQTLNSCESSRTSVAVTINTTAAPTASAQAFCNAATVASLVATGTNLKWYSVASGGTALASITALSTGTYYASQTLNSCEGSRTAVSVTINTTAAPTASAQTYDSGADVADLIASGTNLQWYTAASGGTALASTTLLSTGTYYVSQTLNSCESTRTAVSVTINTAPGAPTASAQAFCNGATVVSLVATGTNLKWYNVASGGTALASTTALSTGTYYVSQTVNSVESTRTAVSVTINITPAPTAAFQTFCGSATVADLVATGTDLKWYTVTTGGTPLTATFNLVNGNFYVSQTLNSCESARTFVIVTVSNPAAPTALAQTFCEGFDVADLVASGTNLKWYNVATGGTALTSGTVLTTGTYYVSQTPGACESSRTAVSVTINTTAAPTASAQTFSNGATVANLMATGINLQWYTTVSGGAALASATALSTGTYYVSQTLNSCESSRTAVSVTINTAPGAPTASAQTFCGSATIADLTAAGANLQWYSAATGGTALASTTVLSTGNYFVSQTVNAIESARTTVSVTVNITAAPTALAQTFCNGATVSNLVATGTTLKWYNVSGGGTALASSTALATGTYYVSQALNSCESLRTSVSVTVNVTPAPTASPQAFCNAAMISNLVATGTNLKWYNNLTGGSVLVPSTGLVTGNFYVSQTLNSCESTRTLVAVTINATPAPTASAQTFNSGATVANLVATGTNLQWYTTATGGTALASTIALSTGTYYVSQTLNSCEGTRASVSVTINTVVGAPTASAQTFCGSATVANLVATGTALKWYNVATGGTALISTTALASGNYYVSQTVNSVESARTIVSVTINITAAPVATAQTFCGSAIIGNLIATGTALKWYNVASGGTALASTTALSTGTYYASQTINSCEGARTSVLVTINTTAMPAASAQTLSSGATVASLAATGTALKWYNVATGGTALATTTVLVSGTYYVSQTVNSCESARRSVAVTITTTTVTAAPVAFAQTFCSSTKVSGLTATGTNLKWYTSATGGSALNTNAFLSTATYYVSQTVNSVESARTAVSVTVYSNPVAKSISLSTSQGTSISPVCITDVKVLTIGSGYSATNIQWERAVVGLNNNIAPASSSFVPIDGATGPTYTVNDAMPGRNYFRAKFTNGSCEVTAVYSANLVIYYKDCLTSSKLEAVGYPNPFSETFSLKVTGPTEDNVDVTVYDMMGKLIGHTQMSLVEVSELKLGDTYPSGIYNVVVAQGDQIKTVRVVKR